MASSIIIPIGATCAPTPTAAGTFTPYAKPNLETYWVDYENKNTDYEFQF
jgi:hypothetical protein